MHHVWSIFLYPLDSWHYLDSQGDILFLSDGLCGSSCDTASRTAYMLSKQLEHGLLTPVGSFPKAWCAHPRTFPMPFGWSEFVAHFVKVYTMVKIPRFFFVKKSHALVWGDGGPIPHQLLPAKEVIENEWTRPPQKTFLGVWAVLSSMFFFLFGRMKLCWNVSLRFDKRITESFFPTNKITPHFFLAGKATTNLVLFFQSELPPFMCSGWKCSVSQGEVPFRGNIAPKLPNVFILFFGR